VGTRAQPQPANTIPSIQGSPKNLPGANLDFAGAVNAQYDISKIKDIAERMRQALKSYYGTEEIGWKDVEAQITRSSDSGAE